MKTSRETLWLGIAAVALVGAGCAKKPVATAPPPPQPSPAVATARSTPPASSPIRQVARQTPPPASPARPRVPDAKTQARIDELLARIQDAYFDYDRHELRPDALNTLASDSRELRDIIVQYPTYKLTIEGYCDERGSAEYNMALGDARSKAAKDYLVGVGIPSDQLKVVSYGKEKQVCNEHDEACWQKNRRVHILAMAN
jgi:peptidoglycan-associated lipoprotein